MATLTSKYSLVEQAKRVDPDGTQAVIAEVLSVELPMLLDAPWMPSNDLWNHKSVRRGTLPTGSWRKLNSGVATEVSRTTEVLDVIGMLETYAEYDKEYIDNMPNPKQARMDEAVAFLEGLSQTLGSALLYGDSDADPDKMHGLAPRMATIDSQYIYGSGGTGSDLTSIYIVTWDRAKVHMIYPKNSEANLGVKHTDLGEVTLTDATTSAPNTSQYQGYRDHFQIKCGLVVRDPRCIGRLANIESSGTSNIFDEDNVIKILNRMKVNAGTRMYCNDTVKSQMEIALKDKNNVNYSAAGGEGLAGEPVIRFRGIPVRMVDRTILLNTESAIS